MIGGGERRKRRAAWGMGVAALLALGCGCAGPAFESARVSRYRPTESDRVLTPPPVSVVATGVTSAAAVTDPTGVDASGLRLRKGDKVGVSLRGPRIPEDIREVVDDLGCITMPLVGEVNVEGLSTAEAEQRIREAYVSGGFYQELTVIVVAEAEHFFVRGEVKREGSYPVTSDLTLLKAVIMAGGFTDFARPKRIRIIRKGMDPEEHDATRVERREAPDPPIRAGDIVVVPRRFTW